LKFELILGQQHSVCEATKNLDRV